MTKKRIGIFSVVVILTILMLSAGGCNQKDNNSELNALNSIDARNLKEATLTFYFPGAENGNAKAVLKELEKRAYNELKVKLNFRWINRSEYMQKIFSDFCSNSHEFDGFYLSNNDPGSDIKFTELAKAGYLKDIGGMLQEYAPGIYGILTREQLNAATYGGRLFAVPNLAPNVQILYAVVREDLRKKYSLPEIKTYNDYEKFLKVIKANEDGIHVPAIIFPSENSLTLFANAYNYSILDKDLQLVYKRDDPKIKIQAWEQTPEFSKASNKLLEWETKGLIQFSDTASAPTASILCHDNITIDHGEQYGKTKFYRLYPDITIDRESPINACIAFNANSSNVGRALMFINWIESNQKNYDLFMYGIEGIDYTLDAQNRVLPKDSEYLQWQGRTAFMNFQYERPMKGTVSGNSLIPFIMKNTAYPLHTGFYPDYSEVSLDASNRKNVLQYMEQNLQNGFVPRENIDPDIYKSYVDGTEHIVKAVQKQFDKWMLDKK